MKKTTEISRLELLEHVALPMGNLSRALEALLEQDLDMDSQDLKKGLRSIQANAESIYQFLTFEEEKPTSTVGKRTPQVLKQLVADKCRPRPSLSVVEG